jgi:hypothetical protein
MAVVVAAHGVMRLAVAVLQPRRSRMSRSLLRVKRRQKTSSSSRNRSWSSQPRRRRSRGQPSAAAATALVVLLKSGESLHLQQHLVVRQANRQQQQQ